MATRSFNLVIAVDGPAASGKGTIAKAVARHYGLPHMDTGALYRAVGLAVLRRGGDPADAAAAEAAARALDLSLLEDRALRDAATSEAASGVAVHPAVRQALFDLQRSFAAQPGGAVLDGRDIGTVIAPQATAKLFVTASDAVRSTRRQAELASRGEIRSFDEVLADLRRRDARDSHRHAAPLAQADDAALLDTSDLAIDAAVQRAIALVEDRIGAMRERG
ncbi:MAG: (d)CMP kinase [Sphingomonadaceae bacterium]|nr:(d)CMP kinase [Sphingomonadaceae bacterium]